jgi:hypothetical protein
MICEWFGIKTTRTVFSGFASKPVVTVSGGLASKPTMTVSSGLALKPVATVSGGLASKPAMTVSSGLASKPATTVSGGLASKPAATVSDGLASKPAVTVSRFGPQNRRLRFGDLGIKITMTLSWFGPQNQAGFGFSVAPQNRWREVVTGHTSRSSGLFRVEANQGRLGFPSLASRLAEARRRVVHVAPSWRLRQMKLKTDGSMRWTALDPSTPPLPFLLY